MNTDGNTEVPQITDNSRQAIPDKGYFTKTPREKAQSVPPRMMTRRRFLGLGIGIGVAATGLLNKVLGNPAGDAIGSGLSNLKEGIEGIIEGQSWMGDQREDGEFYATLHEGVDSNTGKPLTIQISKSPVDKLDDSNLFSQEELAALGFDKNATFVGTKDWGASFNGQEGIIFVNESGVVVSEKEGREKGIAPRGKWGEFKFKNPMTGKEETAFISETFVRWGDKVQATAQPK